MTDLIYFTDCYATEFDATVTLSDGCHCELDRTAFYPEGGGQPSDTGTLRWDSRDEQVTRVYKSGSQVIHDLAGAAPGMGKEVKGSLDWERRYAYMRYHTAQHLLSAHFLERHGAQTTGNQISRRGARIDFDLPALTPEIVREAEEAITAWVAESIPVVIRMLPREMALRTLDASRTRIDRLPRSVRMLRIVEIEGVDTVACWGTHVRNTSEIGEFRIIKTASRGKGRKRIEFVLA
jgi:misacylated tRNA(Ala) deacylase